MYFVKASQQIDRHEDSKYISSKKLQIKTNSDNTLTTFWSIRQVLFEVRCNFKYYFNLFAALSRFSTSRPFSHEAIIFIMETIKSRPQIKSEAVAQRCSVNKMFLEIAQNSQENTCQGFFFNKVAVLRPASLLKRRLWHRCFPVNFVQFIGAPFSIEHLWRLLL